jgi:hypothetical protein
MRIRSRFEERCQLMRAKTAKLTDAERARLEKEQAFVFGYEAGKEAAREDPDGVSRLRKPKVPLTGKRLRTAWLRGYSFGKRKGLVVKLEMPA